MKEIYVIGASGFGKEVCWLIEELNTYEIVGFIDDNKNIINSYINDHLVIGDVDYLLSLKKNINVVIAIANPSIRKKIRKKLENSTYISFPNIIAKDVRISKYIKLGEGNIICSNSILTTSIDIGDFNHINLSCTIGHDVEIHDFVTIYPSVNVSGNVVIENIVEIGTGTQIIQGKKINSNVIVGAGSVVIKNLIEPGVYVGVPCVLKRGKYE